MPNGKPNILFIMGDDIGWYNVSAYNLGVMGYRTPNIDSIARDGALFTEIGKELGMNPVWDDAVNEAHGNGGVDPSYGLAQTDVEGLGAQQQRQALAQQGVVLGDHDPHGQRDPHRAAGSGVPRLRRARRGDRSGVTSTCVKRRKNCTIGPIVRA